MTIEKVILDMDGLIFDSERVFMRELGEVIKPLGYTLRREDYIQTLGLTGAALKAKVTELFGPDYPHDEMSRMARQRVDAIAREGRLPVKPGIRELLEYLRDSGIFCAVASSTHRRYVELYLKAAGLRGYFDIVIGGDDVARSKPEPDIFLAALGDVSSERALVLEDSENGILAAHNAKIPVICIPDMAYPRDEIKLLTYATLKSAAEVIDIIG